MQKAVLERFDGLVDYCVYGIDYVVDEGLGKSLAFIARGLAMFNAHKWCVLKVLGEQRVRLPTWVCHLVVC